MASLGGKSKPKTLSKSKSSKAKTVSKYASDSDENAINIKTLRKPVKLRKKVKKELKHLGLVDGSHSETELSGHESGDSDDESEKPVSSKKSKKKRSKQSSRSSISSDSDSPCSLESSDSSASEKKKKKNMELKQRPQIQCGRVRDILKHI